MTTIFNVETVYQKGFREGCEYKKKCIDGTATFGDHIDDILNRIFDRLNPDERTMGYVAGKRAP